MQFLQQIIYDFVGWGSSDTGDDTTTAGDPVRATTCCGSSYSSVLNIFFDLTTEEGREDLLYLVKTTQVNKNRMAGAFFSCRLDGVDNHSVSVRQANAYCQYCKYKFNEMNEHDQANKMGMRQNRGVDIDRCLTCNVNLCWRCRMTWHNVSLDTLSAEVSRQHGCIRRFCADNILKN